jgi:paraquat-inducible protein B
VIDARRQTVQIPVTIVIEPQRFKQVGGFAFKERYEGIKILVKRGLRAQLKPGNLLTGQLYVNLDFFPGSPPAELVMREGETPEIPTIPSDLDEITRSVTQLLEKLGSLPLEAVVSDARDTLKSIQNVVNSPDIKQSLQSLRETIQAADAVMVQANATLAATENLVGPRSQARADLVELMKELKNAARSIRVLADYLERHPEALIHGKGGPK